MFNIKKVYANFSAEMNLRRLISVPKRLTAHDDKKFQYVDKFFHLFTVSDIILS